MIVGDDGLAELLYHGREKAISDVKMRTLPIYGTIYELGENCSLSRSVGLDPFLDLQRQEFRSSQDVGLAIWDWNSQWNNTPSQERCDQLCGMGA